MNASGWWRGGIIAWVILSLAACSENVELFSSIDDRNELELSIIAAGSVIRADDPLDVQIRYPSDESSRATYMRIELQDSAGRVQGTVEFDRAELAEPRIRAFAFSDSPDEDYSIWGEDENALNEEIPAEDEETLTEDASAEDPLTEDAQQSTESDDVAEDDEFAGESESEGESEGEGENDVEAAADPEPQEENSWDSDEGPMVGDDDSQTVEGETWSADEDRRWPRATNQPQDGVYTLVTEAWTNNELLLTDRRQIFITANPPKIDRITIHPSTIRREMQALAMVDLEYSETTRPYLRWFFDGELAAEGYFEDRLDRAILDGGHRSKGAYEVLLEVYPWGVEEGVEIDGNTTITAKTDVVVGAELLPDPPVFIQPFEGSAVRYFSFDGTRQAWVVDPTDSVEAGIAGEAYLDMVSGALGVRVGRDGVISAPLPVPDGPDSVHMVAMRISSTGATTSFHDEPVLSFAATDRPTRAVPMVIENGMLLARPVDGTPIPLGRMPDQYELTTFRFLVHDRDGSTFLQPLLEDGPSGRLIDLGAGDEGITATVGAGDDLEMFVDRITVTSQTMSQIHAHFVRRGTERFLESVGTGRGEWALSVPSDWTGAMMTRGDYPDPRDSIGIAVDDAPTVNVLLPDGGGLSLVAEEADESERTMTLRRRGRTLELTDERAEDAQIDRIPIPRVPELLSSFRLQIVRSVATEDSEGTAQLKKQQDEQGLLITLSLPESVAPAEMAMFPEASEAHLPAWVGRWIR